jgi:multiple sugar transport system ATP-binding protein
LRVRIEGLWKQFSGHTAVCNVSATIKDGEFFVLLGPSGCGKTTTLRMIAGLEAPSAGRVFFDDQDVTFYEPRRRDIAMVFQDYGLYPHLSVIENIMFPLKVAGVPKAERRRRAAEVSERLEISPLLKRKPPQISGGEKQRVALARALVRNPKVFLMDEPLSNLDAKLRVSMRAEIKRLVSEAGITTIYVTHDQIEAMALATRIAVMNQGEMVQIGNPLEIYDRPATNFVAGFIGSPPMNMFDGRLNGSEILDVTPRFLGEAMTPARVRRIRDQTPSIGDVVVGIRPEYLQLVLSEKASSAVVELVEPLGQDTYVYLRADDIPFVAVTGRTTLQVGDRVEVRVDEANIQVMDKETGRNVAASLESE